MTAHVHLTRATRLRWPSQRLAALRSHPHHPEAWLYLAICLRKQGDRVTALREALTAAQLESNLREQAFLMDWFRRAANSSSAGGGSPGTASS